MAAHFDDLAMVEHDQAVHRGDGREAMGDGDHGLAGHQPGEALLDRRFHFRVERRGRLVEDEDRRILEEHAGDGDALALAAGKLGAALADMRVEALPAPMVRKAGHERIGMRLTDRIAHRVFAGIRPAVEHVLADRAVQQRGVLRDEADLLAQRILRDLRDILPVDDDAAGLDVVEAQQQVGDRRFAGARAADEADLLAGLYRQRQVLDDAALLAVVERDVLEADLAARHLQLHRVGRVDEILRPRDRLHALLHGADVVEDADRGPHDPARHGGDADREAAGDGDVADRQDSLRPEPHAERGRSGDQEPVHGDDGARHRRDEPRRVAELLQMVVDRVAGVVVLARGVREELHRLDVGVAVDDAAGQHRPRLRYDHRPFADARHEIDQHEDEEADPDGERDGQPHVELPEEHQRAERVDGDEPDGVADLHRRFAQRRPGLDDLRRDAPGEIVGEEADRLPQHIAVRLPADEVGERRRQRLLDQKVVDDGRDRPGDDHDRRHPREGPAVVGEDAVGRRRLQHVDDRADVAKNRHLDQRDHQADRPSARRAPATPP